MLWNRIGSTSFRLPQLVVTGVHRDSINPGCQGRVALELPGLSEHSEECLLSRVKSLVPIAHYAETDGEDPILVVEHDLVEGVPVAGHDASDEFGIGRWRRHGRKRNSEITE